MHANRLSAEDPEVSAKGKDGETAQELACDGRSINARADVDNDDPVGCEFGICDGNGVVIEEIAYIDPNSHMPIPDRMISRSCPCRLEK